jgi:hypothetical protein
VIHLGTETALIIWKSGTQEKAFENKLMQMAE